MGRDREPGNRVLGVRGVDMPETRLFEVAGGQRLFGVKRFDRGLHGRRFHVHAFGNLIQANFRLPSSDYTDLIKATGLLCRDRGAQLKVFRQAAFNIAAHNRDDHVKNLGFKLDEESGRWDVTPAYDLTCAPGPGGEHTTTVVGEGREHLRELGRLFDFQKGECEQVLDEVSEAINQWSEFANEAGAGKASTQKVAKQIGFKS